MRLEDAAIVAELKARFAPDGGAEREHNATVDSAGFAAIHYALVRNVRPERALAIGSRYGYIPAAIALGLKAAGRGRLDFVDANFSDALDGFAAAFGGVGHWGGDAASAFRALDLDDVVEVHVMTSSQFFERCGDRYGYIYLDGDHSYEGCRHDLEGALRVAEPGALVAMHDVLVTDACFGVGRVLDEAARGGAAAIVIPAWPGLGILQVRRAAEDV
jgi:predicted O-methyltransferase YrrM